MSLTSFRSAMRSIITLAIGLLSAGFLTSCGLNTDAVGDPTATSQPSPSGGVRLGCGTYCQSAGGLAGTLGPGQDAVTIMSSGTIATDANNYLPVSLTCNLSVQCKGSLVVQAVDEDDPFALGRSDLQLDAGASATLGVLLPDSLVAYLRAHNPANVFVIADVGPSFGCDGKAETPTGAPVLGLPWCGHDSINGFRAVSVNAHSLSVGIPR